MNIKAIETRYDNHRFRSRLEARWAVFFNTLGIKYEYEKEGFDLGEAGWYLPDFWLPQVNMWAEVKPDNLDERELVKARALALQSKHAVLLLVGLPDFREYEALEVWDKADDWNGLESELYIMPVPLTIATEYLDEHRFFATNYPDTEDDFKYFEGYHAAVAAARSARFEHGEHGR